MLNMMVSISWGKRFKNVLKNLYFKTDRGLVFECEKFCEKTPVFLTCFFNS